MIMMDFIMKGMDILLQARIIMVIMMMMMMLLIKLIWGISSLPFPIFPNI